MAKQIAETRGNFRYFSRISTRWMDNDIYAHVNNVIYYSWFDTAINGYLLEKKVLDFGKSKIIGLVVESSCQYFAPIAFPDQVEVGVRVAHLGNSSVRYEVGIFRNDELTASAQGFFVNVYVDRENHRPASLPPELRRVLEALLIDQGLSPDNGE